MNIESKVLMNRPEFTEPLIAEAKRVAALGGSFSFETFYLDQWYLKVTINYPQGVITFMPKATGHEKAI